MTLTDTKRYMYCDNCDSSAHIVYDVEQVEDEPEICPFCGANIGTLLDEFDEFETNDDLEEDLLDKLDEE